MFVLFHHNRDILRHRTMCCRMFRLFTVPCAGTPCGSGSKQGPLTRCADGVWLGRKGVSIAMGYLKMVGL